VKDAQKRSRRLVSRSDLAQLGKVSLPAITKLLKGKLGPALFRGKIDVDHPAVREWLASKGVADGAPTELHKTKRKSASVATGARKRVSFEEAEPTAVDLDKVADHRRELDELEVANARERLRERQLRNEEAEGRLIPKEPIRVHIFGALSMLFKRLLEDVPHTVASRVLSGAKSGLTLEQAEALVQEVLQGQLGAVKAIVTEALRDPE
jgi:hypothetical protein